MLVISVLFLAGRGNSHMKMMGLLVSLRRRHCSFWFHFGCAGQKADNFNHKCITRNWYQLTPCKRTYLCWPTTRNIVQHCWKLRPFARSFRVVRKEISTMKRRCHNELENVLLWLSFLIVTDETGYEYWQTVKMKTTVFSFLV